MQLMIERSGVMSGAPSSRPPTRRSCAVAAALGFALDEAAPRGTGGRGGAGFAAASFELGPGEIALLTGASGSGKTTFLESARGQLRRQGALVIEPPARLRDVPLIDQIGGSLERAMRGLARAGLGEAACFVRRPGELSQGQVERLRLALAFERALRAADRSDAPRRIVLSLDEFCARLDGLHARAVATLLARFVRDCSVKLGAPVSALVATPRDDLVEWLGARVRVEFSLSGAPAVWQGGAGASGEGAAADPLRDVRIEGGDREDYRWLAPLHYRAQQPATIVRVLRAVHESPGGGATLAGVLVVSMPALNARWRAVMWPGAYDAGPARDRARRLNEEVRTISRVIVDPRFRSLGLASKLVRAYLEDAQTRRTEAVAAMGHAAPFFERAGMRGLALAPSARDARLLEALARMDVAPWRLATPRMALRRATDACEGAAGELERELRLWANGSRGTRRLTRAPLEVMFRAAARSLACISTAYAHGE